MTGKRTKIRCAIYTRKSHEEGLDQEFNSLDAQRQAGEAYIESQRHEGWQCLPKRYDDGGFSGGTMDRTIMIGDSETDIKTAKAASVPAIGVSFGYTDKHVSTFEPEHVIDHYDEAWDILECRYGIPLVRA